MAKAKMDTRPSRDLPEQAQSTNTQEVMQKIILNAFSVDFLKDPEDALCSYKIIGKEGDIEGQELNSTMLDVWEQLNFEILMNNVCKKTGADPEQLRDPEKRTDEQQQAILKASAAQQSLRMNHFRKSRYYQAIKALDGVEGNYHSKHEENQTDLKDEAILYYFVLHGIKPTDKDPLTDEQKKDISELFHRLDNFFIEADPDKDDASILYDFIEAENPNTNLPVIITKKLREIAYPLDKVNASFWGLEPGQQAELKAESDRDSSKGKQASIFVLIDFDEMKGTGVTISRPLTSYDKRVFIASANLKEQGHDTITTAQIYEAMGNRGRPSAAQRQKILKSIETMSMCRVTLDNSEEAEMYSNYDKVQRSFYLLPTTIDKGYVKGLIVDDAITIIELPRLFVFAKKRGQFTSTPVALLESPISQTEANLQLEDYILTRIARMKNDIKRKKSPTTKILLDTVFKNCNIDLNDRKRKSRAIEKIERLMKHYQKQGFIKNFKMTTKSIDIHL